MAMILPIVHEFSYNLTPDPWNGARDFGAYSAGDSQRIGEGLKRVCSDSRCVLVPVLEDYGYYYVAITRVDLKMNVVQFRLDFASNGKYAVRERPVAIPDTVKRLYPQLLFDSVQLSPALNAAVFWDVLRVESLARCESLITQKPHHLLFTLRILYVGGRNCFTAAAFNPTSPEVRDFDDEQFQFTLSAVLQQAAIRLAAPFAQLVPFDGEEVEKRINRRKYVGVLREANSTDINMVCFDGNMKQYKVVVYDFVRGAITPVIVLPQLPGIMLVSRRLSGEDKDELMQKPVRECWTRPSNRITPVGTSPTLFANAVDYAYDNAPTIGRQDRVPFDAYACSRIQEGLASVCSSGGPAVLFVSLTANIPPVGSAVSFVVIDRNLRDVNTMLVTLFDTGRTLEARCTIFPTADMRAALPGMNFSTGSDLRDEMRQACVLDVLLSAWTRRIDQLIVFDQPQIVTAGVEFEYIEAEYHVAFDPVAAERVERVVRIMCADATTGSAIVPVPEVGQYAYVAAVRNGVDVLIGFNSGLEDISIDTIEPLRSLQLNLPNLRYMPFIDGAPMSVDDTQTRRDLFETPIFTHWQQVANDNPHNWSLRAAAFGLAMHPRAGRQSPMRVLDAELIAQIANLCLH
jgi:hypothetical protein